MQTVPMLRPCDLPAPLAGKTGWPWTDGTPPLPAALPDGAPWPRVTIVTPSYNQGQFVEETLRSVLLQGYPNLEYIVMDGGSTDQSVDIIRRYEPWLSYWTSGKDSGQSQAINAGLERGTGEVFGWMNSDDLFMPGGIRHVVELRAAHPDAVAWVGACQEIDRLGARLRLRQPRLPATPEDMGDWSHGAHFYQPSCLFSPECFRRAGELDESLFYCMDIDLWVRMARLGRFASTSAPVSAARLYPEARTFMNVPEKESEFIAMNVRNGRRHVAARRLKRLMEQGGAGPLERTRFEQLASRAPVRDIARYLGKRMLAGLRKRLAGE